MNAYQSHTDRELAAVLVRSEKLTYTAKLNLRREFQKRHLDVEMETLLGGIQMHEVEIKQLKHLKDLGFTCQENSTATGIEIHRLGWAVFMDVMAIILGLVLTGIGLVYVWLFYQVGHFSRNSGPPDCNCKNPYHRLGDRTLGCDYQPVLDDSTTRALSRGGFRYHDTSVYYSGMARTSTTPAHWYPCHLYMAGHGNADSCCCSRQT